MEENYILLHGYTATPNDDFHPWLKKQLEKKGYVVEVPELPNTNNPIILEQVNHVLNSCNLNENTTLLGHSLGTVVAIKVLERLKKPVKKLILVAGFIDTDFPDHELINELGKTINSKFDFKKVKKNAKEIILLRAKNDTAVSFEQVERLHKKIGGRIVDFTAAEDHVCGKKEPVVLEACLS